MPRTLDSRALRTEEPFLTKREGQDAAQQIPRRSYVGVVSLVVAFAGSVACHIALVVGPFAGATWLRVVAAGFEAGVVGGLADWFAVTALFRYPLGLPIPHTNIIRKRREKVTDAIINTAENQWLSPAVISERLERLAPSAIVVEWLRDSEHVKRIGGPLRDLLRGLARMLTEGEVVEFAERSIVRQLREIPIDQSAGRWLIRATDSPATGEALKSLALSLKKLAERPRTAQELHWWLMRSARALRDSGQRIVPFLLRRKIVQRKIVEAALGYASAELLGAAEEPDHPLRRFVVDGLRGFAERLGRGDAQATLQVERIRAAIVESLETGPLVRDALARLRQQIEEDLANEQSRLSLLIDEKLHSGIVTFLEDPSRRSSFDRWVRTTVIDLARRYHHQIGLTIRESLERLNDDELVQQIESRVGADLQFIRLNGAVVGGLIGILLAVAHLLLS